jgi:uncharacterized protein
MMDKIDWTKEKVLITGASSGIGKEFAMQCHQRGASVVLVARRTELLAELAASLLNKRPNSVEVISADLSKFDGEASCRTIEDYLSSCDVSLLVNNAGKGSFGYFDSLPVEREQEMIDLNVTAVMRLTRAVLPGMKRRGTGGIITLSSVAAFQPLPYMATYAATKAFDFFFAMGLWAETKGYGIRSLIVCPGPTQTEFAGVARVPGTATDMYRDSVTMVVEQSMRAFEKGQVFVVPGIRSRFMAYASRILPATISSRIVERTLAPVLKSLK